MNKPKVLIITINYNQAKMTKECVDSVLLSDYENFELLVVDNGSEPKDFNFLVENLSKKVMLARIEKNCGYVCGVNFGLEYGIKSRTDYYLVMNNDTIIDRNAITELIGSSIRHKDSAIVSGKVYHYSDPKRLQYTGSYFKNKKYFKEEFPGKNEIDFGQFEKEEYRDMLDDIFWLIPRNIFDQVGYYSNNFFLYAEQADYALRSTRKGYKLIYSPKAAIWHKGSITTGDGNRFAPHVCFWRKKSFIIFLFRNAKKKHAWTYLIYNILKYFLKVIQKMLLRRKKEFKIELANLYGIFFGLKWVLNKKPDDGYNPFL